MDDHDLAMRAADVAGCAIRQAMRLCNSNQDDTTRVLERTMRVLAAATTIRGRKVSPECDQFMVDETCGTERN